MLEVLIRHAGQLLSRERKKLGSDSIETVRGMGYRLTT
jgi:DNA-binding winged helix-turn-helix (wHTH) protein